MSNQYVRAKDLLEAELGDEIVALDVDGGNCFGFNAIAADVWRLLATPCDFEAIQLELLDRYDVSADQCGADLSSLLADLQLKGLIEASPSSFHQ